MNKFTEIFKEKQEKSLKKCGKVVENMEKWLVCVAYLIKNLLTPVENQIIRNKNMLTARLNCIVSYVNSQISADIGTDHAYVATELIKLGRAKKVIASDVRKGPLNMAVENIKKHGMEDKIQTRLGSGLSVIKPYEADTAIIAGMGGELICDIINNDIETARSMKLILQPMNAQYELRKYLIENDFTIEGEDIECEGHRVYNILIVKNGRQKPFLNDIEYHIPYYLKKNKYFHALYDKKMREFKKIIKGLEDSNICDNKKLCYYKKSIEELEKMKND